MLAAVTQLGAMVHALFFCPTLYPAPCLQAVGTRPNCTPFNTREPTLVENSIFKGQRMLHIAGLPSTDPQLFQGKRRRFQYCVQASWVRGSM